MHSPVLASTPTARPVPPLHGLSTLHSTPSLSLQTCSTALLKLCVPLARTALTACGHHAGLGAMATPVDWSMRAALLSAPQASSVLCSQSFQHSVPPEGLDRLPMSTPTPSAPDLVTKDTSALLGRPLVLRYHVLLAVLALQTGCFLTTAAVIARSGEDLTQRAAPVPASVPQRIYVRKASTALKPARQRSRCRAVEQAGTALQGALYPLLFAMVTTPPGHRAPGVLTRSLPPTPSFETPRHSASRGTGVRMG